MAESKQELADRFETLVAPLERKVYFTCLGMMGNPEDAMDAAQEALLKAFGGFSKFREEARFSTWLYQIAVNACLDALRKRKETLSLDWLREEGYDPADDAPDAFLQLEEKQRKQALKQAIARLPAEFRAAVVLVDLQGLSYQEAADALDVPIGTVRSRVSRARKGLQKILTDEGELFSAPSRPNGERRET